MPQGSPLVSFPRQGAPTPPARRKALRRDRNRRYRAKQKTDELVIRVTVSFDLIQELINMGYLQPEESEDRAEIARALLQEHADIVALHRK
jgi:hypothetical protein